MGLLDSFFDTFRASDPKRVKARIAVQIQEHQATKKEIEGQRRILGKEVYNLNQRLNYLRKNNPSLLAEIRAVSGKKTDLEYQELELKTALEKLDKEIERLTAAYRRIAA